MALRATSPDPETLQKKHKNKTNKQKIKNKKNKKKKKEAQKKTAKIPKNSFSAISQIFPFLDGFSKFPFFTPWPKKPEHKKHYKNRGFRPFFLKSCCASRNGHFWTKKPNIYKFQLSFCLAYFLLFQQQKTQKSAETPIFIVFLLT